MNESCGSCNSWLKVKNRPLEGLCNIYDSGELSDSKACKHWKAIRDSKPRNKLAGVDDE